MNQLNTDPMQILVPSCPIFSLAVLIPILVCKFDSYSVINFFVNYPYKTFGNKSNFSVFQMNEWGDKEPEIEGWHHRGHPPGPHRGRVHG